MNKFNYTSVYAKAASLYFRIMSTLNLLLFKTITWLKKYLFI